MSYNDIPDAPWIGKCREDYYGYNDEEEPEFDEDFAYECWRDMKLEEELYGGK